MKTALLKGKNRWLLAAVLVIAAAAVFERKPLVFLGTRFIFF